MEITKIITLKLIQIMISNQRKIINLKLKVCMIHLILKYMDNLFKIKWIKLMK